VNELVLKESVGGIRHIHKPDQVNGRGNLTANI